MIRLILFAIVGLLAVVGGLAVALYHFFGWKGLVVFPLILVAVVWLAKVVITSLVKKFALGLFGMKAGVLKGATMNVHAIRSVPKPPEPKPEKTEEDAADESDKVSDAGEENEEEDDEKPKEVETPKDYVEVDVTITPKGDSDDSVWEPTELMLTSEKIKSLADLEDKEVGTTHSVEIWNGTAFGPDDPGKYPGEQRLKIIFAVKLGAKEAWLHYYNEPIGQLKLPPGTIDV
ncbi:MAG: hypothetical protein U1F83_10070 [Verrucomicrobiota bacterium]